MIRPIVVLALLAPIGASGAQRISPAPANDTRPSIPLNPGQVRAAQLDTAALNTLKWREIGPYRGGRSVAVAGSEARPNEYYFGTTGGGVFKSLDGGQSWAPVTDKYFGGTVGAVSIAPSNPDVVYVGGGEYALRGNVSHGEGVWKTTDAGKTWTSLGLKATRQVSRVVVHPTNPDVVYVAAQGNVWAPTPERGIYRSRNGGKDWDKVLFRDDSTGASDLAMDPSNPSVLYAAFWQAGRTPWMLNSGGKGSGVFKSTDGGDHWTDISHNPGMPAGIFGNIGITVSAANPRRVFAIIEADSGGVYRSDDAGATWLRTNADRSLRQRAWYYSKIHADTKDTNIVYVNNVSFQKSTDGGKTFRPVRGIPHGDSHDFWIAPGNNQRMIEGDDGGASVSADGGRTWSEQDFATAQFYHVITTNHFPYQICGAQQDNSTLCGPSRKAGGIDVRDWVEAGGGESGYIASRQDKPDIVYAGSYGALLTRKDLRTGLTRNINPWPDNPMGHSAIDLKYRFQWTYPIVLSPHDPNVLYATSNYVHRTTNDGQSWEVISPDLTRNDPKTLGPSGGPLTKDQTSVEYYGVIFSFAESPRQKGVLWTGSDDGLVHVSRDNGKTWKNVTPKDMAIYTRVSLIEASHFAAGTAYIAANRFQLNDDKPYLWKTSDFGTTWQRIDAGIDPTEFTRAIREDDEKKGQLYVGTERGVWFSHDDGSTWQRLQLNLPPVPVHDLAIKEGDLIAATHGRSFYVIDDISPLRQLTPTLTAEESHLFKPRDAYRVSFAGGRGGGGGGGGGGGAAAAGPAVHPVAASPSGGPVVNYWLKRAGREVVLEFMDARGQLIKSFTSKQDSVTRADSIARGGRPAPAAGQPAGEDDGPIRTPPAPRVPNKVGINAFNWNMRYPDASTFEGLIMWAAGTQGPVAPPGTYKVRMLVDGSVVSTETFTLKKDPRTDATQADLLAQFDFLKQVRDRTTAANDAVKTIRWIHSQLDDREKKLTGAALAEFTPMAAALRAELAVVEGSVYQTKNRSGQDPLNYPIRLNNKIAALAGVAGSAEAAPTRQTTVVYTQLSRQLETELVKMKKAIDSKLPAINTTLRNAKLPEIVPRPADVPAPPGTISNDLDDDQDGHLQ
ncbi:MAG: glycosyl hydrolase [Gemmatimonadaceae bacterium]